MAQFSEADINEAKRRVMDMRNRANRYAGITDYQEEHNRQNHKNHAENNSQHRQNEENQNKKNSQNSEKQNGSVLGMLDGLFDGDKDNSFVIILVLILILNKEGADNKLILALLYLLL